jgi:hypothetical protein
MACKTIQDIELLVRVPWMVAARKGCGGPQGSRPGGELNVSRPGTAERSLMKYNGTDLPPELEQALVSSLSRPSFASRYSPAAPSKPDEHWESLLLGVTIAALSALLTFLLLRFL